jgi:transcriptional regulator with XRE-family HTH domain
MLMVGEKERRDRFGYALQQALTARGISERQLAQRLGVDQRQVARWRTGRGLPDLYQTQALVAVLRVSEDLFRNPPPVPTPPAYPIEDYLLDAVERGAAQGLSDEARDPPDEPELAVQQPPPQQSGRKG